MSQPFVFACGVAVAAALLITAGPARAGDADVVAVKAIRHGAGRYDIAVTVRSRDTGWDRYADRLEAVEPDGRVLATRVLDHPHDDEQPFTRDITGVTIAGAAHVTIRVHFKPTGFDGATRTITLPGDAS